MRTNRRSVFIEFAGMPKSGKTTVMDTISHYLRRSGVALSEYHGGGRYAPVGKERLGELNIYLACQLVQHLVDHSSDRRLPRLHLLDRGAVDRIIFTRSLRKLGRVSQAHEIAVTALLTSEEVIRPDLCFIFVTSPELSLAREHQNKLLASQGSVMNDTLLTALRATSLEIAAEGVEIGSANTRIVLVDTAPLDGAVPATARLVLGHLAGKLGLPMPAEANP